MLGKHQGSAVAPGSRGANGGGAGARQEAWLFPWRPPGELLDHGAGGHIA